MIESAKLTFSRIGVHFFDGQPRNDTIYMPRIVLRIQGRKSGKTGYLAPKRFEKKDLFPVIPGLIGNLCLYGSPMPFGPVRAFRPYPSH